MKLAAPQILTLNAGSSSIKFALYPAREPFQRGLHGKLDGIGSNEMQLTFQEAKSASITHLKIPSCDPTSAANFLMTWFEQRPEVASIKAVGHRIIHGMQRADPELITPDVVNELNQILPYAPEHLPREIELINLLSIHHPEWPQVACFDTAFHRTMPRLAKLMPLPRRYDKVGIQRYGFHGLSCTFLMEELGRIGDPAAKTGRVLLAHLGNGASLTAVRHGQSIDTSMGFTPTAGLVMGTRSGDLDPGLAAYLAQTEKMGTAKFYTMANHESGMLGVSETTSDVRELLALEGTDERAAEALALFCYQAKKWIGSFAAALHGLDTLVFTGGIGENCPTLRSRICEGLQFLDIELNPSSNAANASIISSDTHRVVVRVIRTDEELIMARSVFRTCPPATFE